jgi:hypothetical protein
MMSIFVRKSTQAYTIHGIQFAIFLNLTTAVRNGVAYGIQYNTHFQPKPTTLEAMSVPRRKLDGVSHLQTVKDAAMLHGSRETIMMVTAT